MSDNPLKVSEETSVSIPLKNLIGILVATTLGATAYMTISHDISDLQNMQALMLEEIEENDSWIDNFEPPPEVQDTIERVRELERQLAVLEERIRNLK